MMRTGDFLALARPRVSLMVGAAALFGGLLHGGGEPWRVWAAALGSVLVCAGCSALNQVQERGRDALMRRTRNRPLASGRMAPRAGLALCVSWLAPGLVLYALSGGAGLVALGLTVVAVYNGLYTPLKPVTGLALLAGGLAGAAPPVAGWLAAGGGVGDVRILSVAGAFYIWQVPHFWLIAQAHAREYARAGFRLPWGGLSPGLYRPLMGLWMLAHFTAILAMAAAAPRSGPWIFATACMGAAAMAGFAALGRAGRARRVADITLAAALCCLLAV